MNVGEYGTVFNLNTNYDMSGFTSLALEFTRPGGTRFTRHSDEVSIPDADFVSEDGNGTFAANQYASYIFRDGDLAIEGTYSVRLTYTDAGRQLVSDAVSFTINP